MASQPPSPFAISPAQFLKLLALYPAALAAAYDVKVPDDKKRARALEDDEWRYRGLPRLLRERQANEKCLEKAELERFVRWKITHGQNRPFLPSQVRKNEASLVKSATSAGFAAYTPHSGFPKEALKHLTTLHGVGPATATLLLSVYDPENVPFFQDELYAWLMGPEKLKYTLKEYEGLWEAVEVLRKRLGGDKVSAVEAEKVGFVVGHWKELQVRHSDEPVGALGGEANESVEEQAEASNKTIVNRGKNVENPADVEETAVQDKVDAEPVNVVASGALPPSAEQVSKKGKDGEKAKRKRVDSNPATPASETRKSTRNK